MKNDATMGEVPPATVSPDAACPACGGKDLAASPAPTPAAAGTVQCQGCGKVFRP